MVALTRQEVPNVLGKLRNLPLLSGGRLPGLAEIDGSQYVHQLGLVEDELLLDLGSYLIGRDAGEPERDVFVENDHNVDHAVADRNAIFA
jgi:hypothetical protein